MTRSSFASRLVLASPLQCHVHVGVLPGAVRVVVVALEPLQEVALVCRSFLEGHRRRRKRKKEKFRNLKFIFLRWLSCPAVLLLVNYFILEHGTSNKVTVCMLIHFATVLPITVFRYVVSLHRNPQERVLCFAAFN